MDTRRALSEMSPLVGQDYSYAGVPRPWPLLPFFHAPARRGSWRALVLGLDLELSARLYHAYRRARLPRAPLRLLEFSGHGVTWLALIPPLLLMPRTSPPAAELLANFYLGILVDLILIALTKLLFRRPRPHYASDPKQVGTIEAVDAFGFPSGHTTRCGYIAVFACAAAPGAGPAARIAVAGWALSVMASRVLYGRHYVGDIIGGALGALVDFATVSWVWIPGPAVQAARHAVWRLLFWHRLSEAGI